MSLIQNRYVLILVELLPSTNGSLILSVAFFLFSFALYLFFFVIRFLEEKFYSEKNSILVKMQI